MDKLDVVKIDRYKKCKMINLHNNHVFALKRDVIEIMFRNGTKRRIDMLTRRDITNAEYMQIHEYKRVENVFTEINYDLYN